MAGLHPCCCKCKTCEDIIAGLPTTVTVDIPATWDVSAVLEADECTLDAIEGVTKFTQLETTCSFLVIDDSVTFCLDGKPLGFLGFGFGPYPSPTDCAKWIILVSVQKTAGIADDILNLEYQQRTHNPNNPAGIYDLVSALYFSGISQTNVIGSISVPNTLTVS